MFEARRKRVLDAIGPDAVAIFIGANLATRSADTQFPFRQNSDFWYLTGFDHPAAFAVLRTDGGPAFSLFVEPRDRAAETWTGYRPGIDGALEDYGADAAFDREAFTKDLPEIIEKADRLYHVLGVDSEVDKALLGALESLRQRTKLGFSPAESIIDPRTLIHEMRLFKDEDEIAIMREAADISREAHAEAAKLVRNQRSEFEIEAALGYVFRRRGGTGPAYSSIVAGGANATTLHYVRNDQKLQRGQLVLVDAGAEYRGYASDVTRTYPVDGRFEAAGRAVYDVVLAAQKAAIAAAGPGTTLPDIHAKALEVLIEGMLSFKLLTGTVDDIINLESYRPYYMHGTSHWLGLDVHDAGNYSRDSKARTLEPGMTFTVEPGLYIPKDDESAPASLRGIGVRIEDNLVITRDGHENLNEAIPKEPRDLEALIRD